MKNLFDTEAEKIAFAREWDKATESLKKYAVSGMDNANKRAYYIVLTNSGQAKIEKLIERGKYTEARVIIREQINRLVSLREAFPTGGLWK